MKHVGRVSSMPPPFESRACASPRNQVLIPALHDCWLQHTAVTTDALQLCSHDCRAVPFPRKYTA